MRALIALLVVIYLVGVGVALAPTVQDKWTTATASELVASIVQDLPRACAWPQRAYLSITEATRHT